MLGRIAEHPINRIGELLLWNLATPIEGHRQAANGLPGVRKLEFNRVASPPEGQCCEFESLGRNHHGTTQVAAGGHYWIVVWSRRDSVNAVGGWNLNTLGLSGPYAIMGHDGVWTMTEGPLPAVRVIAK